MKRTRVGEDKTGQAGANWPVHAEQRGKAQPSGVTRDAPILTSKPPRSTTASLPATGANPELRWPTVAELNEWREDLMLPAKWAASKPNHWLPDELGNKVTANIISLTDMRAWAATCKCHFGLVNSTEPLLRLRHLMRIFPPVEGKYNMPSDEVTTNILYALLPPKYIHPSRVPMAERLRCALLLALKASMPTADPFNQNHLSVVKAVQQPDNHGIAALRDVLDRSHRMKVQNSIFMQIGLKRMLDALLPVWDKAPQNDACRALHGVALYLPLFKGDSVPLVEELVSKSPAFSNTLVLLALLPYVKTKPVVEVAPKDRIAVARYCLDVYKNYVYYAIKFEMEAKGQGLIWHHRAYADRCIALSAPIVKLNETLGLSAAERMELFPNCLQLLQSEFKLLCLRDPGGSPQDHFLRIHREWAAWESCEELAQSMSLRFGELTDLAIALHKKKPQYLQELQSIAAKWPEAFEGAKLYNAFLAKTAPLSAQPGE